MNGGRTKLKRNWHKKMFKQRARACTRTPARTRVCIARSHAHTHAHTALQQQESDIVHAIEQAVGCDRPTYKDCVLITSIQLGRPE